MKVDQIAAGASGSSTGWTRVLGWCLAISYAIGAPGCALLEYTRDTFSTRFDVAPSLIYATCATQLLCAIGVLMEPVAPWAAAVLTLTSVGAIGMHLRIGSPLTALPALVFTIVQIAFVFGTWSAARHRRGADAR